MKTSKTYHRLHIVKSFNFWRQRFIFNRYISFDSCTLAPKNKTHHLFFFETQIHHLVKQNKVRLYFFG